MKLIRADKNRCVFRLGRSEKELLCELLRRYPLVPSASQHHRVSTQPAGTAEPQRLLDEALAAQREENRRQVQAMLHRPGRFKAIHSGYHLTLSSGHLEWLLQVLNDVRVGSWIALGSPDTENGEKIPLNDQTAPHLWLMELAGGFEMELLEAMGGRML